MKLTFYIIFTERRKIKFDTAKELDEYIKNHRVSKTVKIQLKYGDVITGEMSAQRYSELQKQEK